MTIKSVLDKLDIFLSENEFEKLKRDTNEFISLLKKEIKKNKVTADVFVGGSFAKRTLVKKEEQDIDIFVRFNKKYDNISTELEKIVEKLCFEHKLEYEKVHGSRDYFRINQDNVIFEIIPVIKINNPKEAQNVTDLSYFHVNYVKKKLNKNIARSIVISKQFCAAQGVYGAESYISGISGYGLECLIIYYKSFEKMAKAIAKTGERIIIDSDKKYKNKNDIFVSLNESKLQSPIILIDPTWKERNVLAALSKESFERFKESLKQFVKNPDESFFQIKSINEEELKQEAKKKKAEFLHLILETGRQEGDIAGTKMKKFSNLIVFELNENYEILRKEFEYEDGQEANFYLILKGKKEAIKQGPPVKLEKHAKAFRKQNKDVFEKKGILYAREKVAPAVEFIEKLKNKEGAKIDEMSITNLIIKTD